MVRPQVLEVELMDHLETKSTAILKPELSTDPKCYYVGLDVEVK